MRLDPFSATYCTDPAKTWKKILGFEGRQVLYDPELGVWLIAGHDNVRAALTDTRRFANRATLAPIRPLSDAAATVLAGFDAPDVLVSADGPQHTRIRNVVRALLPNTLTKAELAWSDLVAARVDQVVDNLDTRDSTDLMRAVAVRVPLLVILDILGVPTDQLEATPGWGEGFVNLVWGDLDPATQLAAAQGLVRFWDFCRTAVADRATDPASAHGFIGELLRYRDNDDNRLTTDEIAALVLNLTMAGWESTTGALGHALEHALLDPDRWSRLADDEHYLTTHIEETLRHSPAVDGWMRLATTDVTLDGVTIPAGSRCLLLIGTANHDPRVYGTPTRFDPGRAWLSQHLAFGAGSHYCPGAALARLELATTLRTLAQRHPGLRLAADYQRRFRPNVAVRTHITLPATTDTAARCPLGHHTTSGARQ